MICDVGLPVPLHTSALVVLRRGHTLLSVGDTAAPSYVASMRKSLVSVLYGTEVAGGGIDLDSTLDELGITDLGGLLPVERTARVRDLLTSRSGVYHRAATPGGDEDAFPERGSRRPGRHFVYNNWDFNVAESLFEDVTGQGIFTAFEERIARPLGFEDYEPERQRVLGDPRRSAHLAHHFFLSARDLAKVGLLMAARGAWGAREVVPASWVDMSLYPHVRREQMPEQTGFGGCDYGFMWWLVRSADPRWRGAFLAVGNFGQFLLVLPAMDSVIVHRRQVSDAFAVARNSGSSAAAAATAPVPVTLEEFMQLARAVVESVLDREGAP